jgi:hypothetical protein
MIDTEDIADRKDIPRVCIQMEKQIMNEWWTNEVMN